MPQDLEDTDLAGDPFHVGLLHNLLLLQDLDRYLLFGGDVDAQLHFAEGALAQRLALVTGLHYRCGSFLKSPRHAKQKMTLDNYIFKLYSLTAAVLASAGSGIVRPYHTYSSRSALASFLSASAGSSRSASPLPHGYAVRIHVALLFRKRRNALTLIPGARAVPGYLFRSQRLGCSLLDRAPLGRSSRGSGIIRGCIL